MPTLNDPYPARRNPRTGTRVTVTQKGKPARTPLPKPKGTARKGLPAAPLKR